MDQQRFQRVKELFQRALARPAGEREAWVREAAGGDAALAEEVRDLLAHAAAAGGGFLEEGAGAAGAPALPAVLAIPGFRVLERLATGGSGAVFRAEQQSPRRVVALKVLRLDSLGPGATARFEREAAILAGLDHPGIARVIESGVLTTESVPLPWIALEFVQGSTLDDFVSARRPGLRALLELFAEVCDAVEHAHQRDIVHRDLKPSNVMIDTSGRPRVLDFGVARTLTGPDLATAERTRTGTLIGTLAYMAPEQARGERVLGPSADVYALGAMLFELLTGRLPLALDELDLLEGVHAVCSREPESLQRLRPDLPQDLDTILAKTLEKEPARRYATAGELAADLRRFLAERPVLARRPTAVYQMRKFVRRNRTLSVATAAVFLALATGLGLALVSLGEERRQRSFAGDVIEAFAGLVLEYVPQLGFGEERRGHVEGLVALLEQQLDSDPGRRGLRSMRARLLYELAGLDQVRPDTRAMVARLEAARSALLELGAEEPDDLETWTTLSRVYAKLGEAAHAEGDVATRDLWFARALELDQRLVHEHPGDPELVEDLGWSYERLARIASERADFEEALRLTELRWHDAEELVRLDPENWKYLYNLSSTLYYLAGLREARGELSLAIEHILGSVTMARRLCEVQPNRRDALRWLADACLGANRVLKTAGKEIEGRDYAEEALVAAEEVVRGDPYREEHLHRLADTVGEVVLHQRESGTPQDLARTAVRLRGILRRIGASTAPSFARLEAQAAALESEGVAAAR